MARHDIRGLKLSDGTYSLTSKDVYNLNDNFIQLSQEIFGNSSFTRKIEKRVNEAEKDIVELKSSVDGITISINTTTHSFTADGYILKDSNGEALITPNGVANEQNIGRVDNVEAGYPMKIPFHIGSEVSQIKQAVLKWDMSQFRTYSKGAASGGGVRTTPSGGAGTTDARWGSTGIAVGTTGTTATDGLPHSHQVYLDDLSHSHSTPSHTHSMDITHEHAPVFGILETGITVDYIVGITIDGVYRAQVNALRGEIDLSAWITTNGWHELILSVNGIKRLDANLFLKTYIRR